MSHSARSSILTTKLHRERCNDRCDPKVLNRLEDTVVTFVDLLLSQPVIAILVLLLVAVIAKSPAKVVELVMKEIEK